MNEIEELKKRVIGLEREMLKINEEIAKKRYSPSIIKCVYCRGTGRKLKTAYGIVVHTLNESCSVCGGKGSVRV
jgi:DnaJ-class molecular chaperone